MMIIDRNDRTGRGPRGGLGGRGGGRGGEQVAPPSAAGIEGWFAGRLPDGWSTQPPEVVVDRDEVVVVVHLAAPDSGGDAAAVAEAEAGRTARFREDTREERMRVAREAEHRYGRVVSWGAQAGGTRTLFTTQSVPVMTRLRQPERLVLDTLVEAGVARSRSDALAWCVRTVGANAQEWLGELRESLEAVQRLREAGPAS
ncbi:MAG: Smu12A [Frankiales bacterium]|nr:Smu12A [Frankiales bacterium]